jgi:hypothetical protein
VPYFRVGIIFLNILTFRFDHFIAKNEDWWTTPWDGMARKGSALELPSEKETILRPNNIDNRMFLLNFFFFRGDFERKNKQNFSLKD